MHAVFGAPRDLLPLLRSHDLDEWHGEGRVGHRLRAAVTKLLGTSPGNGGARLSAGTWGGNLLHCCGSRKMLKGPAVESEKARGLGQRVEVGQGRAHARKTSSFQ